MGNATSGIGVLDKAVAIVTATAVAPRSLGELCEATGLPRATAHRLAVALESHRLLARDAAGRFTLGRLATEWAATRPDPLVAAAQPALAWLRDESGESSQLYRRDGDQRVCVAAAEREHGLRTTVPVGSRLPLTAGSGAQVLCAWSPSETVAHLLAGAVFSSRTLADVRRRGWAQSVAQREAGVASVSAPVFNSGGLAVAAISVSGPVERLGRSPGQRLSPVVQRGAEMITAALN